MNDLAQHKEKVYSGVRWSAVGQAMTEVVKFGISVTLARLLVPEIFGLVAMAGVVTGFLSIFKYLGTTEVIIQRQEISQRLLSSLFYVNVFFGLILSSGIYLSGPILAKVYDNPDVAPVISLLGLTFFISSFGQVQRSLLNREMKFNLLIPINLGIIIVRGVVAIILALLGWGVWALIASSIVEALADSIFMWIVSKWRPNFVFSWEDVKSVLSFSANVTGSSTIDYFTRHSDDFIIGRWLGAGALGYYSMAYNLYLFPLTSITRVLMRVLFPAFSRMQDNLPQMKNAYLKVCSAIAIITFPLMIGLTILAHPFVMVVFGEKWMPVIPIIMILGPVGMLQSLATPNGRILIAKGKADWQFRWSIVSGGLIVISFFIGLPWGLNGIATAYACVMLPVSFFSFFLVFKIIKGKMSDLFRSLKPVSGAALFMGAVVFLMRLLLDKFEFSNEMILLITVPLGAVIFISLIFILKPPVLEDYCRLLPGGAKLAFKLFGNK